MLFWPIKNTLITKNQFQRCHRISDYEIPEKAINAGEFDMQFINLNIRGHDDKKICD